MAWWEAALAVGAVGIVALGAWLALGLVDRWLEQREDD